MNNSTGVRRYTQFRESPIQQKGLSSFSEDSIHISKNQLFKLFSLSRSSQKVLLYLISESDKGKAMFNLKNCKSYTGYNNDRSVFDGLIELLGEEVIFRGKNQSYFINEQIIKGI